jgi:hypothetical protein
MCLPTLLGVHLLLVFAPLHIGNSLAALTTLVCQRQIDWRLLCHD